MNNVSQKIAAAWHKFLIALGHGADNFASPSELQQRTKTVLSHFFNNPESQDSFHKNDFFAFQQGTEIIY